MEFCELGQGPRCSPDAISLQDVPLITNIGSNFEIKPVNYFDSLASMDIVESNEFQPCAAQQGVPAGFNYTYTVDNTNPSAQKGGYKYSGALSSDEFEVYASQAPAPAPMAQLLQSQQLTSSAG